MAVDRSIEERLSHVRDDADVPPVSWFAWDHAVMSEASGTVCHMEKSNPNRDNDQRLIVAAPEMSAALRLVQGLAIDSDVLATVDAAVKAAMEPEAVRPSRQARRHPQAQLPLADPESNVYNSPERAGNEH